MNYVFRKLTEELEKVLRRDRSPLAENPYGKNENSMTPMERMVATAPPLDPEMQKHLSNFSLITHGFGGPAIVAGLNAFKHYLNSMKLNYEKITNPNSTNYNLNSGIETSLTSKNIPSGGYAVNSNGKNASSSNTYFNTVPSSSSSSSISSNSSLQNGTQINSSRLQNLPPIELTSLKVESKD